MPDHDAFFAQRGRTPGDDYFWRKDRELVEKIRRAAAAEKAHHDLGQKAGLSDPAVVTELLDLGFTPDTVALLPLVPVIQMAWAEGGITGPERELILRLAKDRGIEPDSAAANQLTVWMTTRPPDAIFAGAGRLIRAMFDSESAQTRDLNADGLVQYCEDIASASGGILGIRRISGEERSLLSSIAADLKTRRA